MSPSKNFILIVEDDCLFRMTLHFALRYAGFSVDEAPDGLAALEKITRRKDRGQYDFIISDINMPFLSGIELIGRVEGTGLIIPTLLMSGYVGPDATTTPINPSLVGFMEKPFNIDDLITLIRNVLGDTPKAI